MYELSLYIPLILSCIMTVYKTIWYIYNINKTYRRRVKWRVYCLMGEDISLIGFKIVLGLFVNNIYTNKFVYVNIPYILYILCRVGAYI